MSTQTLATPTRARANVQARKINAYEHDCVDYDQSLAWRDFHDEWVERQTDEIIADHERDLIDVITAYCETSYISVSGLKLNYWADFDRAIRAAIEESPCFRDFVEKAALMQAERDFGKMVKQ